MGTTSMSSVSLGRYTKVLSSARRTSKASCVNGRTAALKVFERNSSRTAENETAIRVSLRDEPAQIPKGSSRRRDARCVRRRSKSPPSQEAERSDHQHHATSRGCPRRAWCLHSRGLALPDRRRRHRSPREGSGGYRETGREKRRANSGHQERMTCETDRSGAGGNGPYARGSGLTASVLAPKGSGAVVRLSGSALSAFYVTKEAAQATQQRRPLRRRWRPRPRCGRSRACEAAGEVERLLGENSPLCCVEIGERRRAVDQLGDGDADGRSCC